MTLQDGLLSFQIKETIFLSSDKTGIGELKELELVPDIEILENSTEVSITGCLQLHGKYEPVRSTSEEDEGGADTLVAAMKFTPFQFDRREGGLYGSEQELVHRIPLNITIPSNRVSDIADIYAIVDSIDYQLESPNQLVIEAELKIAGIALADEEKLPEPEWEFVHVAQDQEEPTVETASLDDIERKLAQLEQEIARKETEQHESTQDLSQPYFKPYVVGFEPPAYQPPTYQHPPTYQPPAYLQPTYPAYQPTSYQSNEEETQQQFGDVSSEQQQNAENETVMSSEQQTDDFLKSSQVTEVAAQEEDMVQEPPAEADVLEVAQAEEPVEDAKEMRVAIGSKPSQAQKESLNLTSIFAQASRAQEHQSYETMESSSSSLRRSNVKEQDSATLEAMHNLTSFVRNKEERYSTMKLCIIQRDETLESISARYSLPVSKILEVNKLSSDRVVEGQILYIPV
jgi:stage VI sporulation protein D